MIKVAVVGSGYRGKTLVRNFHALGALAWVCDTNPKVLDRFRQMYTEITTIRDPSDLLEDSDLAIDALP